MARLDRLAPGKEVAQVGATLGREFSYELLQAVAPVEEASLQQALATLVEAEVLYQRGLPPQPATSSNMPSFRCGLSVVTQKPPPTVASTGGAGIGEAVSPGRREPPELVAHHYTEAGPHRAGHSLLAPGGPATIQRSANEEAVTHLTTGLELLKTLRIRLSVPTRTHAANRSGQSR